MAQYTLVTKLDINDKGVSIEVVDTVGGHCWNWPLGSTVQKMTITGTADTAYKFTLMCGTQVMELPSDSIISINGTNAAGNDSAADQHLMDGLYQ